MKARVWHWVTHDWAGSLFCYGAVSAVVWAVFLDGQWPVITVSLAMMIGGGLRWLQLKRREDRQRAEDLWEPQPTQCSICGGPAEVPKFMLEIRSVTQMPSPCLRCLETFIAGGFMRCSKCGEMVGYTQNGPRPTCDCGRRATKED